MGRITVVGLGPGNMGSLPLENYRVITGCEVFYARTAKHPAVGELREEGVNVEDLDRFYEDALGFDEVYENITAFLLTKAEKEDVVYGVPGHPLVGERTVEMIIERCSAKGIECNVLPAMSFLDELFVTLHIDPVDGLTILDGLTLDAHLHGFTQEAAENLTTRGMVVCQVYNGRIASNVKLSLMDIYPDEHQVVIVRASGVSHEEKVTSVPLYKIDRIPWIDHLVSLFVPPLKKEENKNAEPSLAGGFAGDEENFSEGEGPETEYCYDAQEQSEYPLDPLVGIMARLRDEDGCPWDKEQTHQTLKKYLLEETYEVLEALDDGKMHKICEELGDLLLQIAFHAQLASEEGHFDMNDVVEGICAKLVRRHPHIFGETVVSGSAEVASNWAKIKEQEKEREKEAEDSGEKDAEESGGRETALEHGLLEGVPRTMPALMRAQKIQSRAARVGFDWPNYHGAWDKVREETEEVQSVLDELTQAGDNGADKLDIESAGRPNGKVAGKLGEELGDLLFAVVNVSRFFGIEAEEALMLTINKFMARFSFIEQEAKKQGRNLEEMSLEDMDILWEKAKSICLREGKMWNNI